MGMAWAQTAFTATYTFGTAGNVQSFPYNGTSYDGIVMGTIDKVTVSTSSSSGNFRATNWPLGATNGSDIFTGSVDPSKYIGFTISAASGYKFTISTIQFGIGRSGTGIRQSQWRGSYDNYGSILNNYTIAQPSGPQARFSLKFVLSCISIIFVRSTFFNVGKSLSYVSFEQSSKGACLYVPPS